MRLERAGAPLTLAGTLDPPSPGPHQVLIRVAACGICRTDLHIVDGELAEPKLPLVLGHEIVGYVAALGASVNGLKLGDRIGVPTGMLYVVADRLAVSAEVNDNVVADDAIVDRFAGTQFDVKAIRGRVVIEVGTHSAKSLSLKTLWTVYPSASVMTRIYVPNRGI